MPIQSYDLAIDQYADFTVSPVYSLVATAGSTPVPVNLTGYTARLMIRVNPTDAVPIVSISTTPNAQGSIVLQPIIGGVAQAGMIQVNINNATTATMPTGLSAPMSYDLDLTTPLATVIDFMAGYVRVKAGNTH
jgi:hypothetical protein